MEPSVPRAPRPRDDTAYGAYAMLLGSPFLFATGVVIVRGVHESIPPVGLTFWRWFAAAMLLLPFVLPKLASRLPFLARHWRYYTEMGFYMVGGSALGAVALSFTTATNQSLVNASQPAMTACVAWALTRTRLAWGQILGIAIAAVGVVAMVSRADLHVLRTLSFNTGDLIMLAAVVLYAFYGVRILRLPRELPFSVNLLAMLICGSACLLPFYVAEALLVKPVPFTPAAFGTLAYLGSVGSLAAVFLYTRAVPVVGANQAAMASTLFPVFTAVLAMAFLGESLHAYHFAGAALIFAGIMMVIRAEARARRERAAT